MILFFKNRENSREGYVSARGYDESILVQGVNMNRAVEGDIVAVEVFDAATWSQPVGEVLFFFFFFLKYEE